MKANKLPGFVHARVKDEALSERSQGFADKYLLVLYEIARQLPQAWEALTKLDEAIGEYGVAERADGYTLALQDRRRPGGSPLHRPAAV